MFDPHLSAACAKPSGEEQILSSCKDLLAKAACGRKSKRSQTLASSLKPFQLTRGKSRVPPTQTRLVLA